MKTLLRTLTLCTVLVSGPALADTVADEARQMALMGAPDLALGLLDRQPPDSAADPERWVRRERARIEILQADGRWERVVQRAESLPDGLPLAFTAWVRDEQLSAYQQLAQGAKMRQLLRAMLWTAPEAADPETFRRWRRLVIESYLVEDRLEDARAALVHYRRDYGDEAPDVAKLQARVQLMLNASGAIPDVLVGMDDHEARALVLLARLRSGVMEPAQVAQAVERETARGGLAPQDQARYGYVAAEAARQRQDRAAYAHFIERALVYQRYLQHDHVFRLDGERLWGAYLALGHALGNEAQLLVGQDEIWMAAAEGALIDDDPRTARGYLAVLAIEGQTGAVREEAHRRLTRLVLAQDQGPEILYWLYLRSERFQDADRLPLPVRHVLADHLLARGEVAQASQIMAGISDVPEGEDPFEWRLRRARLLILGGHDEQGVDALHEIVSEARSFDKAQAERLKEVLFDLQTLRRHQATINLFVALEPRLTDEQQAREFLFWQADSYRALGEYEQAARLYLRSATLHSPQGNDPWGQAARLQAAEALATAGLLDDARRLYEGLIRITRDPAQRAVLQNKLQQLMLKN